MNTILRRTEVDRTRAIAAKEATNQLITWGFLAKGRAGGGYFSGEALRLAFPNQVVNLSEVERVDCFLGGIMATTKDGRLFMCGSNGFGPLGLGDTRGRSLPTQVLALSATPVKEAHGNGDSVCALLRNGEVRGWSAGNLFGNVGCGDAHVAWEPVPVETAEGVRLTNVVGLAAGAHINIFIREETPGTASSRRLWYAGESAYVAQVAYATAMTKINAELEGAGVYPLAVACSTFSLAVLCSDGKVRTAGNNAGGGPGNNRSFGGLWGIGTEGEPGETEAGTGPEKKAKAQTERYSLHVVKRLEGASLVDLTNIVAVSCSQFHTLALEARTEGGKGRVYGWGNNDLGQCGSGTYEENVLQAQLVELPHEAGTYLENVVGLAAAGTTGAGGSTGEVGTQWSTALLSNGEIMNWGGNKDGELGNLTGESENPSIEPVKLAAVPILYNDCTAVSAREGQGVAIINRSTEAPRSLQVEPGPEPHSLRATMTVDIHDRLESLNFAWRREENAPGYEVLKARTGSTTNAKGELNEIVLEEEPKPGPGYAAIETMVAAFNARVALGEKPEALHINDHNYQTKPIKIPAKAVIVGKGSEPNGWLIAIESKPGVIAEGGFSNSAELIAKKETYSWSRASGTVGRGSLTQSAAILIGGGGPEAFHFVREWSSAAGYEPGDEVIVGAAGSGVVQKQESEVPKDTYRCIREVLKGSSAPLPSADPTHWLLLPAKAQLSLAICPKPERAGVFSFIIRNLPLPALWPNASNVIEVEAKANFEPARLLSYVKVGERSTIGTLPLWNTTTNYAVNDEVTWQGAVFKCIQATTGGTNYRGLWVSAIAYAVGDTVLDASVGWRCIKAMTGGENTANPGAAPTLWAIVRTPIFSTLYFKREREAKAGVNRYLMSWPNRKGGGSKERGHPFEDSEAFEAKWLPEIRREEPYVPFSVYASRARGPWKSTILYKAKDAVEVEQSLTCTATEGSVLLAQSAGAPATFGKEAVGASSINLSPGKLSVNAFTKAKAGKITKLTVRVSEGGNTGTAKLKAIVYADDGTGRPGALLAEGTEVSYKNGEGTKLLDLPIPAEPDTTGTRVHIGIQLGGTGNVAAFAFDATGGEHDHTFKEWTYTTAAPTLWSEGEPVTKAHEGTGGFDPSIFTIYATYTIDVPVLSVGQIVAHSALPAGAAVVRVLVPGALYELNCVVGVGGGGGISGTVKATYAWVCLKEVAAGGPEPGTEPATWQQATVPLVTGSPFVVWGGLWKNKTAVGSLSAEVPAGAVTSLPVTLGAAVRSSGLQIEVNDGAGHSSLFNVSANVERGANRIPVSGTASFAFPAGSAVTVVGARAYNPGEVVEDPEAGEAYVCKAAVAQSATPTLPSADPTHWTSRTAYGKPITARERWQNGPEVTGNETSEVKGRLDSSLLRTLCGTPCTLASEPLELKAKGLFESLYLHRTLEVLPPGEAVGVPTPIKPPRVKVVFPPGTPAGTTRPFFKKGGVGPCQLVVDTFGTWTDEEVGMTRTFEWLTGAPTELPGAMPVIGATGTTYTIAGVTTGGPGTKDTGAPSIASPVNEITIRLRETVTTAAGRCNKSQLSAQSYCIQS